MTRLLALAASTRPDSLNKKLLAIATAHAEKAGAQVTVMDYASCDVPLFRDDDAPFPQGAKRLSDAIRAHDGFMLASPEYNWSIPGVLKNLIDWLSVDDSAPLKGRNAFLMCASPSIRGGILGLQQLGIPLSHLGVHVYPHLFTIGEAAAHLNAEGISNVKEANFLEQCVTDFVRVAKNVKG